MMFGFKKATPKLALFMPVNGKAIAITDVADSVFSQKMLGPGFAVVPSDGAIYAPLKAKVTSIFPTKHAISLLASDNTEILVHMGLDTVELNGKGINVMVAEGDQVDENTQLAALDLNVLAEAKKDPTIIVVFTNLKTHQLNVGLGENVHSTRLGTLTK
ncbi:PTS sugar transporter subunit IIA [Lacticaseibacillus rhamnosus]|nr:PTS glucose transporter subunit IIA [Lacticaseibacillus rhamnosus]